MDHQNQPLTRRHNGDWTPKLWLHRQTPKPLSYQTDACQWFCLDTCFSFLCPTADLALQYWIAIDVLEYTGCVCYTAIIKEVTLHCSMKLYEQTNSIQINGNTHPSSALFGTRTMSRRKRIKGVGVGRQFLLSGPVLKNLRRISTCWNVPLEGNHNGNDNPYEKGLRKSGVFNLEKRRLSNDLQGSHGIWSRFVFGDTPKNPQTNGFKL